MAEDEQEFKNTTINLLRRHNDWIESKGRGFNFSEWVREQIDKEIKKESSKK